MKKLFLFIGISLGIFIIGAINFSILKAKKWSKHFGMSYFEFAYQLSKALEMLREGELLEEISEQTGIDFTYEDMKKYFIDSSFQFEQNMRRFNFGEEDDVFNFSDAIKNNNI
jgi:hypothetical protein